jgi:hypothetical protein
MATKLLAIRDCPLSVSLPSQNLPPTEGLLQTFNALENLTQNVNEIFKKLNNSIADEKTKLVNIQERIKQCDMKVKHIGNHPNNVCTIYSAATFPAVNAPPLFSRILTQNTPNSQSSQPINQISMTNYRLSEQQRFRVAEKENTIDLFLQLSRATLTRTDRTIRNDTGKEGLGRFPHNLTSTSAVILFNSDENPYKSYESFNNLESVSDVRKKVKVDKSLAAAPTTISSGIELPGFQSLQFDYRPDMGVLPSFALPTQLDLKNVANINFDTQAVLASIAPSLTSLPDLPSFGIAQHTMQQNAKKGKQIQQTSAPPPAAVAPPPAAVAPPPAVIQQTIAAPQPVQQAQTAPQTQQQTQTIQQAPQPVAIAKPVAAVVVAPAKSTLPTPAPARGGLMDAIRQGMKLKKVDEDAAAAATTPSAKPAQSGPPSLQSVLFAGIQRHADLMNGKADPFKQAPKKQPETLTTRLAPNIQKRLMEQESDNEESEDSEGDDWVN